MSTPDSHKVNRFIRQNVKKSAHDKTVSDK
jgi:hypothetical protein